MKKSLHFLRFALALGGLTSLAQALPELRIFDGTTTYTITDGGVGDIGTAAGRVVWDGIIGIWTLNTHVGTTFPSIGSLTSPMLDLGFNGSSSAAGTLVLTFSADGFGPTFGLSTSSIGGVTAGTVSSASYGGTNNTRFSTSNLLASQGPFSGAFGSATTGGTVNNQGPYALTHQITITHNGAGLTTGNGLLTVPESSSSLLLLGFGLTGLALVARFRARLV
jgi:hypothetical protein